MGFFGTCFGSFYSAAMYARRREAGEGIGAGYSIVLFLLQVSIAILLTMWNLDHFKHTLPHSVADFIGLGQTVGISAALRAVMLVALAVVARIAALVQKKPMGMAAGLRMAGAGYTPVVVADTASYCWLGHMLLQPWHLFLLGSIMLLAAVRATR